jgi:heat shock protein HslJ
MQEENPMGVVRLSLALGLALFCASSQAQEQTHKVTVTGELGHVMGMGGETTGWAIQLDSATTFDGKEVHSVEVDAPQAATLEKFENKRVTAIGTISHRQGVETGQRSILEISSIRVVPAATNPSLVKPVAANLVGTDWLLEDLAGTAVTHGVQATLAFPEVGKVAGNGSCNRFFGSVEISGTTIKFGPMGSTRMACPEPVMDQESKYLAALQDAERFERTATYLLIYCKGFAKPLRFVQTPALKPVAH